MSAQQRYDAAMPDKYKLIHSFTLPRPPSVNGMYDQRKSGKRVKSKAYLEWMRRSKPILQNQMIEKRIFKAIDRPVSVLITIEPNTRHKQDAANYEKAVSDIMVHMGVLSDDSLIQTNMQRIDWDKLKGDVIHYDIYGV